MQRILYCLTFFLASGLCHAQVYDYSIGQQLEKIDSVQEYLESYQDLGSKHTVAVLH